MIISGQGNGVNPIYVAYAKIHGKTPDEMFVADKKAWPGGSMTGFILFVSEMKAKFHVAHPEAFIQPKRVDSLFDYSSFHQFIFDEAQKATS